MTDPTLTPHRKKLIEVALPLAEINAASAKEKSIRHGHPSTLHLWWARRPLAACRAVLFASLVDDPSSDPAFADRSEAAQAIERERLHDIIRELVIWENSNNPEVLARARAEIRRCVGDNPPPVLDPFCGGGSIPLEAQRLGLEAHASDLNPVAVLITKALIEIPPKFAGMPPVNPDGRRLLRTWQGAAGLANDVRYYGKWMRDEAEQRIGHLYPKATLPVLSGAKYQGGGEATVIAWLWARTVACPNPACGATMPLVSSFMLSTKKGKETWVEPHISADRKRIEFTIANGAGKPPDPPKLGRGAQFRCLVCSSVANENHIKAEGQGGRMGAQLMAVVAEGARSRVYLPPTPKQEAATSLANSAWRPEQAIPENPRWFSPPIYGMTTYGDLFTDRQLVALTKFSDLVGEVQERVRQDAVAAGLTDDGMPLAEGGTGVQAYGDAIAIYLALAVDRVADFGNSLAKWRTKDAAMANAYSQQALPMLWDFAECNPFGGSSSGIVECAEVVAKALEATPASRAGVVRQVNVVNVCSFRKSLVCTDPPYYDNVGYADLSDSSMSGYGVRFDRCSRVCSIPYLCRRLRS